MHYDLFVKDKRKSRCSIVEGRLSSEMQYIVPSCLLRGFPHAGLLPQQAVQFVLHEREVVKIVMRTTFNSNEFIAFFQYIL